MFSRLNDGGAAWLERRMTKKCNGSTERWLLDNIPGTLRGCPMTENRKQATADEWRLALNPPCQFDKTGDTELRQPLVPITKTHDFESSKLPRGRKLLSVQLRSFAD